MNAAFWIDKLNLISHPEGGYYNRFYESNEHHTCTDGRGKRPCMTSIWFLIPGGVKTHFHRIKSDELWFFHSGNPVSMDSILENEVMTSILLSNQGYENHVPSCVVKSGIWFAAESLPGEADYSLVSCAVAPGFDFADFELMDKKKETSIINGENIG